MAGRQKEATLQLQVLDRKGSQDPLNRRLERPQKSYRYSADSLPHSWSRPATSSVAILTDLSQLLRRSLAKPLRFLLPLRSVSAVTGQWHNQQQPRNF